MHLIKVLRVFQRSAQSIACLKTESISHIFMLNLQGPFQLYEHQELAFIPPCSHYGETPTSHASQRCND